jgi:hypothetical protein
MNIGLRQILVSLRGYGGEAASGDAFFSLLGLKRQPELRLYPSVSPWEAARVLLFSVDMEELREFPEPTEEFALRIAQGFRRAAKCLQNCPTTGLEEWRKMEKNADIFIGGWLVNKQIDLEIPPEFLQECGRLTLPIMICTND